MDRVQALTAFSALAHPDRLDLVRLLVRAGPEGMAAGQIGIALGGLPASRLSFHLAALEGAALIGSRKVARFVIYTARTEALGGLLSFLMRDCCGSDPNILACCNRFAEPQVGALVQRAAGIQGKAGIQGEAGTEST